MLSPTNIPARFFPLPEGHVLLGQGGYIPNAGFDSGHAINLNEENDRFDGWTVAHGFDLGMDDGLCYAMPVDHPLVDANRELVESLNPGVAMPWQPSPSFADIDPNCMAMQRWPELQARGYVLLGHAHQVIWPQIIDLTGVRFAAYSGGWIAVGGTQTEGGLIAAPANHPLALANAAAVAFHNPNPVQATPFPGRPLPPDLPPPPAGLVIVGWGDSYTPSGDNELCAYHGGFGWSPSAVQRLSTGYACRNEVHAYAPDSATARALTEAVRFYNPSHTAVEITPPVEPVTFGKRQWILTLNNAPVASLEELENLCSHLISKPENLTPLTECLWKALEYDDPESRIAEWASREPLLVMVDFLPDKSETDVLIPTIAESSKSIGEIITTAAAGVLLRGGLSNHFNYTEEGRLIINPANPPDLEQGCEILRRTLEVRETGQKLDNYSAWTLGMLGDELERFFGDTFDPSLVMEATGRCYNTYITSLKVYRELWANRRNISFTHHKEALYAKIPMEDTEFVLDTSDRLKLSVAQQRKLVSFVRLYGRAAFDEEPPQDAELLMERLDVKSVNKNFLFFLRSENKWFRYRGPFEHIPNGASPIINADTRAVLSATGEATEMTEWTPIGIEVPHLRGFAAINEAERVEAVAVESTQEAADAADPIEEEVA